MTDSSVVYIARDKPAKKTFYADGVEIPWAGVTSMQLLFAGSDVVADTLADSSYMKWDQGDGVIVFDLAGLGMVDGSSYYATLIVYDPLHPRGQPLVDAGDKLLRFVFKVV